MGAADCPREMVNVKERLAQLAEAYFGLSQAFG